MVKRLDNYELNHGELFIQVVDLIQNKFMHIIKRHAISGQANVNSEEKILDNPLALKMLIDIFSERGFHAMVDKRIQEVPETFDLETGKITCGQKNVYRIRILFEGSTIRRG